MEYRSEIDGLRAFAVIPVLLFHAGITSGGFLGVDVFFVISGYLITGILIESLQTGKFSFLNFYERRARRILPALLSITMLTIPFALYFMSPMQLQNFGESLIAIPLFVTNFLFCFDSNYFSESFRFIPLLHTWSVAVEEQFYLLFPCFLYLIWVYKKKYLLPALLFLILTSLVYSAAIAKHHTAANFYLLPSRIWELMFGALLGILELKYPRPINNKLNISMPIIGLLVVAICMLSFDANTFHPGFITLIPVLGTCAIIWFSGGTDIGTKILSSRLFVGIGLISYSVYLWHLPILTFLRFANVGELSLTAKCIFIPFTLLLSYFSWRYIEQPFRNKSIISRKTLLICVIAASVIIIVFGVLLVKKLLIIHDKVPYNVKLSMLRTSREHNSCYYENFTPPYDWYCKLGGPSIDKIDFAVIGDSLALDISEPLNVAAHMTQTKGILSFIPGCIPFAHPNLDQKEPAHCDELHSRMFDFVKQNHIESILMVSNWDDLLESLNDRRQKQFKAYLINAIDQYNLLGTTVYVVLQAPVQNVFPSELYKTVYRQPIEVRHDMLHNYSVTRAEQDQKQAKFINMCKSIVSRKLVVVDFSDQFCDEVLCQIGTINESYYYDPQHLSKTGALKYIKPFTAFLKGLKHEN